MHKKRTPLLLLSALFLQLFYVVSARAATADIVDPNQVYTYEQMSTDVKRLADTYPEFIQYKSIGRTHYGRDIWAVKLGKGEASVLFNASHHAREWLTTNLVMNMLDQYAQIYQNRGSLGGWDIQQTLDNCSIWFVPMVNPDGVTLQQKGLSAFPSEDRAKLIDINDGSTNFKRWKANAEGIDPNRQYPAEWEYISDNTAGPSFKNYKGTSALQTAEAKAMYDFTKQIDPEMSVSYHSSGEILYWHFNTLSENLGRDCDIMYKVAAMTNYEPVDAQNNPSGGGYSDWFIQSLGRPALTPEIGKYNEEANVPLSEFARVWNQNRNMGLFASEQGFELWGKRNTVQSVKTELTLLQPTELYREPDHRKAFGASLTPQYVKSDAGIANWFRIDTWFGSSWVHIFRPLFGKVETGTTPLTLKKNTTMYQEPFETTPPAGQLAPQSITAFERWGNWYHIDTWLGKTWVQM